jgi:hypothetical protein
MPERTVRAFIRSRRSDRRGSEEVDLFGCVSWAFFIVRPSPTGDSVDRVIEQVECQTPDRVFA